MTTEPSPPSPDDAAAEYVLGTLPADERARFAAAIGTDPALAAEVRSWEGRLVSLSAATAPVEPSPSLWASILSALGQQETAAGSDATVLRWPISEELVRLRRSRSVWRGATAAAASLAAGLAAVLAGDLLRPATPAAGLVAVVNRSGDLPALIVRVDSRAGTVQVRSLAAETPAGRSLELWSIVGSDRPHSLGTVGPGATRVSIPDHDRPRLDGATIAVTVEPPGGSGAAGPTGPVVYTGKLLPDRD